MFNVLNNIFDCSSHEVGKIKIETKKSHVDFMPNEGPIDVYTTYVVFEMDNKTSIQFALYRDTAPVEIEIKGETNESK